MAACLADGPTEQSVAWLPDPTVMIGVLALCAWLQALGASLVVSTYVPVVLAAGVVTWCEWLSSASISWRFWQLALLAGPPER